MTIEKQLDHLLKIMIGKTNLKAYLNGEQMPTPFIISQSPKADYCISFFDVCKELNLDSQQDLSELFDILKDDSYVKVKFYQEEGMQMISEAKITLKGKMFIGQDGYVGKSEYMASQKARTIRNEKLLRNYTLLLACGTAALVIVELLKWYFEMQCH